ncbi:MAG: ankyrin repeat domain-containing protein [Phycisphaerae bacterium]|nr:ankyrin repeat domain-containing protein [Gemmatimonadaceae bacterium]
MPNALAQVREWHPTLRDVPDDATLRAQFTLDDARLVYARQHGLANWNELAEHLRRIPADAMGEPFLAVFEAGAKGNWKQATILLSEHPDVIRARGTNGNTLLNLASSLCDSPSDEQLADEVRPNDRLMAVQTLIAMGADVTTPNERGWTPLHQAAYRNDSEMVTLYLNAGASVEAVAHGAGGTPLAAAGFWGHREAVDVLSQVAIVPANLRMAATAGRADLIEQCFAADGALTETAFANRAFYRPHSGFPLWRPTHQQQEVLDEALVWAAKCGRANVLGVLIARGARVDSDVYRGTALAWAAANGRVSTVEWLLDHGANVNQRSTFGGLSHGRNLTALHMAAQHDHATVVRVLLDRGADPFLKDANYSSTPRGWAEHFGSQHALALLGDAPLG